MPRISAQDAGGQNVTALLDTIAWSEIGPEILADPVSDEGYRVLVGSKPGQILTFSSYADHPHAELDLDKIESTAAGRYQILYRYWPYYRSLLQLPDFGPISQDKYAIRQIKEADALGLIMGGMFDQAIYKLGRIWASLPDSPYGQHTNNIDDLRLIYLKTGGILA